MTTRWRQRQLRRPPPRIAARAAAFSVAVVLIALAIYSVSMDRRYSQATAEAERAILIAQSYAAIADMVEELERDATAFAFQPTQEGRDAFDAGVAEVLRAMGEVARFGGARDAALIGHIQREYAPQLIAAQRFGDALLAGQPYYGEMAGQASLSDLRTTLEDPARRRQEASLVAMQELRASQQQRVLTTAGSSRAAWGWSRSCSGCSATPPRRSRTRRQR